MITVMQVKENGLDCDGRSGWALTCSDSTADGFAGQDGEHESSAYDSGPSVEVLRPLENNSSPRTEV